MFDSTPRGKRPPPAVGLPLQMNGPANASPTRQSAPVDIDIEIDIDLSDVDEAAVEEPPMVAGIPTEILATVEIKSASLDDLDYFQLLEVTPDADQRQIRDAYHRFSRDIHPDRFRRFPDEDLRGRAGKLFRRITEAYYVLRDDARRAQYSADIASAERANKLRYSDESESQKQAAKRRAVLEQTGSTPRGRECFQLAQRELAAGNKANAIRQLKMALMFEPQNERFKETLREVETAAKGG